MTKITYYNFHGEQRALVESDNATTRYWCPDYFALSVEEYMFGKKPRFFWPRYARRPPWEDIQ